MSIFQSLLTRFKRKRHSEKISFVLLTWNRAKFLELCLASLLKSFENDKDVEIIVMNNGSSDNTTQLLESYKNHSLIRIITRDRNYGLNAYKDLFAEAKGDLVVVVDDDVLSFPENLSSVFRKYMTVFTDYGFVALNVIQNEYTDGAKPGMEFYKDDIRDDLVIEQGPTGGWCACFRRKDYKKIKKYFLSDHLDMKSSEDGRISNLMASKLKLKSGLIKNAVCFHACGPYYAKQYGHLEREIEKYSTSGLTDFVDRYKSYI